MEQQEPLYVRVASETTLLTELSRPDVPLIFLMRILRINDAQVAPRRNSIKSARSSAGDLNWRAVFSTRDFAIARQGKGSLSGIEPRSRVEIGVKVHTALE